MSTDDRTPDTREVRDMYDAGSNLFRETPEQHYLGHPAPDYGAEFDRWLTAHDARVEHRATRAEAQSDIRGRAVVMYRDRARQAEAQIKAVREMHNADGVRWVGFPRADEQVAYCTYCQERSPCGTIRTLDGEG